MRKTNSTNNGGIRISESHLPFKNVRKVSLKQALLVFRQNYALPVFGIGLRWSNPMAIHLGNHFLQTTQMKTQFEVKVKNRPSNCTRNITTTKNG